MQLIVQKFGGSSLSGAEKLLHAAHITKEARKQGRGVVVVVSAQGDTTDRLLDRARELSPEPPARELDALLAAGEQASAALFAMALAALGVPAVSLCAWQLPIRTDGLHGDAHILAVDCARVLRELAAGRVVVAAGFQGVAGDGDLTTLGRGGSDTTAVALASALGAEDCVIYTDVDGVFTADPRLCPAARRLDAVSYADMYVLSRAGAQVLHDKCVRLAEANGLPLTVRSCAENSVGTRVAAADGPAPVTGVTRRGGTVTLVGPGLPSAAAEKKIREKFASSEIPLQDVKPAPRSLTLAVPRERSAEALCLAHEIILE